MQVIPAIDLREGACVQLVGGSYAAERIRIADPVAVAQRWVRLGFSRLHVVDLDAATGRGSNRAIVREILNVTNAKVQCGGGVRDLDTIDELLNAGASEVILGTRAVEDPAWLDDVLARYPNQIIVAADTSNRKLLSHGWSQTDGRDVLTFIDGLDATGNGPRATGNELRATGNGQRATDNEQRITDYGLRITNNGQRQSDNGPRVRSSPNASRLSAVLVTAVDREGRETGPDITLIRDITNRSTIPIQASGGVRSLADIRALADAGASATIIGMALYTGALDPQTIVEEMSAWV